MIKEAATGGSMASSRSTPARRAARCSPDRSSSTGGPARSTRESAASCGSRRSPTAGRCSSNARAESSRSEMPAFPIPKWLPALVACIGAPLLPMAASPGLGPLQSSPGPSFARDIRPILEQKCAGCHNVRIKAGGLVVETYEALIRGGRHGSAIVPRHSDQSRLALMVEGKIEPRMPLQGELTPDEIAVIRAWIDSGAAPPQEGEPTSTSVSPEIPDIEPRVPTAAPVVALAIGPL